MLKHLAIANLSAFIKLYWNAGVLLIQNALEDYLSWPVDQNKPNAAT